MDELESIKGKIIRNAEYLCFGEVLVITFNDGSTFTIQNGAWDGFFCEYENSLKHSQNF